MLAQLVNLNVFAFMLIFARVGTALSLIPGFGSMQVPVRIRLAFALAVTFVLTPVLLPLLPAAPDAVSVLVLLIASEALIGAFLGLVPRVLVAAVQTAGTMIAMLSAMANAFINDPVADQQSSIISSFLGTTAITLVFVTDLHHLLLIAVVDSYTLFTPFQGPEIGDMADYMAHRVADSFRIGIQITAPIIVSGVAYYIGLGIMGRLMPQLPVFFFGMPIQIALQMYILMTAFSAMMLVFLRYFEDAMFSFTQPLGG